MPKRTTHGQSRSWGRSGKIWTLPASGSLPRGWSLDVVAQPRVERLAGWRKRKVVQMPTVRTIDDQRGFDFQQAAGKAAALAEILRYSIWTAIAFPEVASRQQHKELIEHFGKSDEEWRDVVEKVNPGFIGGERSVDFQIYLAMTEGNPSPLTALAEHLRSIDAGSWLLEHPLLLPARDALIELSNLIHPHLGNGCAGDDIRRLFSHFLPALHSSIQRIQIACIVEDERSGERFGVRYRRPSPFQADHVQAIEVPTTIPPERKTRPMTLTEAATLMGFHGNRRGRETSALPD